MCKAQYLHSAGTHAQNCQKLQSIVTVQHDTHYSAILTETVRHNRNVPYKLKHFQLTLNMFTVVFH